MILVINISVLTIVIIQGYIKDLLTEREVCTGKYLPEVFVQTERRGSEVFVQTERRGSEVCAKKTKANTCYGANEVKKEFIIWLLVYFILFCFEVCIFNASFSVMLTFLFLCRF